MQQETISSSQTLNAEPSYYAKVIKKEPTGKGTWEYLEVGIFKYIPNASHDQQVGSFQRNYPSLYDNFHAFRKGDKWYALYSKDYMQTNVMTLPDCKDITNEKKSNTYGFCPTGYYVPFHRKDSEDYGDDDGLRGEFGFISGCVWGDDTSWKLRYLDLLKVEKGIIKMDERFGYVQLYDMPLKDAVDTSNYWKGASPLKGNDELNETYIRVAEAEWYDVETGKGNRAHRRKQEYTKMLEDIDKIESGDLSLKEFRNTIEETLKEI